MSATQVRDRNETTHGPSASAIPAGALADPLAACQLADPLHDPLVDPLQAACAGVQGGAIALPHLDAIQASFGRHDVTGVEAHADASAARACQAMGARAFAAGNDVAFDGTRDLHTAAHEAAHVVQQRAGVQLAGGVGESGDRYELHADAVADAVSAGQSAEGLLDAMAPDRGKVQQKEAVQRTDTPFEGTCRGGNGVQEGCQDPETAMEEPLDAAHRGYEEYLPRLVEDTQLSPAVRRMMEHYAAGGLDGLYLPASTIEQICLMGAFTIEQLNGMATDANRGIRTALSLASYEECRNSIISLEETIHRSVMRLEALRGTGGGSWEGNQAATEAMGRWVRPRQDQPNSVYSIFLR